MTAGPLHLSRDARYCADTFNGAVATAALSAAWDIGLLDLLAEQESVDIRRFATDHDLHLATLQAILAALAAREIVALQPDRSTAVRGAGFADAFRNKGFFYWLTRGCSELFTELTNLTMNSERADRVMNRDSGAISVACRSIARTFFDPVLHGMLDGISFGTVADLGCGSGDRIITLAQQRPSLRALGIDVAKGALAVSRDAVVEAGLEQRIELVEDDVLSMSPRPEYRDVDLVTCFLMGHDFWPRDNCVKTLRRIRDVFPNARHLILGDTCRSTDVPGTGMPMFTLGFETVHAVMDQYLPTLDEWHSVIEAGGWKRTEERLIDLPAFSFIFRLTPA